MESILNLHQLLLLATCFFLLALSGCTRSPPASEKPDETDSSSVEEKRPAKPSLIAPDRATQDPLKVTAKKGSVLVEYRVEKVPKLNANERAVLIVFLTAASGPTLDEKIINAKLRNEPVTVLFSDGGDYMTYFSDVATDEKPAREGFRFVTGPVADDVAEEMKTFQRGVTLRLPCKKPDQFDRFNRYSDWEWLQQNGFNWKRIGAEVKVTAALVAYKGDEKGFSDFRRIIVPVSTQKIKVGD